MARLLFLENHDSFSHLLADALWQCGAESEMVDTYSPHLQTLSEKGYAGIVIGPGPGNEQTSPNLMHYVDLAVHSGLPILGVCLGMQALGVYFGAELGHAIEPIHGKVRKLVAREGSPLYPTKTEEIVRYHSLILKNLPNSLLVEATSPEGECMALSHKELPIWGVQYHPEAICTEAGLAFLQRWLQFAGIGTSALPLKMRKAAVQLVWQTKLCLPALLPNTTS